MNRKYKICSIVLLIVSNICLFRVSQLLALAPTSISISWKETYEIAETEANHKKRINQYLVYIEKAETTKDSLNDFIQVFNYESDFELKKYIIESIKNKLIKQEKFNKHAENFLYLLKEMYLWIVIIDYTPERTPSPEGSEKGSYFKRLRNIKDDESDKKISSKQDDIFKIFISFISRPKYFIGLSENIVFYLKEIYNESTNLEHQIQILDFLDKILQEEQMQKMVSDEILNELSSCLIDIKLISNLIELIIKKLNTDIDITEEELLLSLLNYNYFKITDIEQKTLFEKKIIDTVIFIINKNKHSSGTDIDSLYEFIFKGFSDICKDLSLESKQEILKCLETIILQPASVNINLREKALFCLIENIFKNEDKRKRPFRRLFSTDDDDESSESTTSIEVSLTPKTMKRISSMSFSGEEVNVKREEESFRDGCSLGIAGRTFLAPGSDSDSLSSSPRISPPTVHNRASPTSPLARFSGDVLDGFEEEEEEETALQKSINDYVINIFKKIVDDFEDEEFEEFKQIFMKFFYLIYMKTNKQDHRQILFEVLKSTFAKKALIAREAFDCAIVLYQKLIISSEQFFELNKNLPPELYLYGIECLTKIHIKTLKDIDIFDRIFEFLKGSSRKIKVRLILSELIISYTEYLKKYSQKPLAKDFIPQKFFEKNSICILNGTHISIKNQILRIINLINTSKQGLLDLIVLTRLQEFYQYCYKKDIGDKILELFKQELYKQIESEELISDPILFRMLPEMYFNSKLSEHKDKFFEILFKILNTEKTSGNLSVYVLNVFFDYCLAMEQPLQPFRVVPGNIILNPLPGDRTDAYKNQKIEDRKDKIKETIKNIASLIVNKELDIESKKSIIGLFGNFYLKIPQTTRGNFIKQDIMEIIETITDEELKQVWDESFIATEELEKGA
jgi:hypothetical protein